MVEDSDGEMAGDKQIAGPLDAIETVVRERVRLNRSKRLAYLFGGAAIVLFSLSLYPIYSWKKDSTEWRELQEKRPIEPSSELAVPIAVMLPRTDSGPVVDNAVRQLEGFTEAFRKHMVRDDGARLICQFDYPIVIDHEAARKGGTKTDTKNVATTICIDPYDPNNPIDPNASVVDLNNMMALIKHWYYDGVRIFIVTMSGAAKELKREFIEWAESKDVPAGDKPVLLATVASAPGIADRSKGIFRHYIRSSEESSMLATFIEALHVNRVYVFYVRDEYGSMALKGLQRRLTTLSSEIRSFDAYKVEVKFDDNAKAEVNSNVEEILEQESSTDSAVVIIGYGAMVKHTVSQLLDARSNDNNPRGFQGNILVVSTLTEEAWRPCNLTDEKPRRRMANVGKTNPRVHTLEPVPGEILGTTPGVVYQFSFHTLDRALQCKDARGREAFWQCWSDRAAHKESFMEIPGLSVEFTTDGDSDISLRLLELYHSKPNSDCSGSEQN